MDYDYLPRLQKALDDVYQVKFNALFNTKDYGDLRELQGFVKAIKVFGDLIVETNNPVRNGDK